MHIKKPLCDSRGRMSKGPQGQKRPTDVIGAAVMVAKIATGELKEQIEKPSGRAKSGMAGATARTKVLTSTKRSEIARNAAKARWQG